MINCPVCKEQMELCQWKQGQHYEFLCKPCLCWWKMDRIEMTDEDIREQAQL